jgi:O-succinylbenzoic acid--CoA ligase
MSDPLRAAAQARPDAPALDDGAEVWTYAELDAAVGRMARRLAPLGVRPGSTVALVAHPNALAIQALWAVPRAGATLAPLNPRLGAASMERALDVIGPDLILSTDQDMRDPELQSALDADWVTTVDDLPRPAGATGGLEPESKSESGSGSEPEPSPFALLWTSGTSGDPSAVPIFSGALEASADASVARLDLTERDRWYASLSLGHVGGLTLVHRAAQVGCTLLVRGRFSVEALVELIGRDGLTHASLVPTMLGRLLDMREGEPVPSTLRCLLVGGAAAGDTLVASALEQGYPVALTYGLTEACSQVATAPPKLVAEKPGTVGPPIDGLELKIRVDGERVDGEISVRGETVSSGAADGEGWLRTGDLGRLDEDGHLWVSGRISDRIVTGGATVDPRTVERALESLRGVSAAAVAGVPDDVWGEIVVALIVPDVGVELDSEALMERARERLSASELPRRLEFVDELPLNANGKIDRAEVRAIFSGIPHA